MFSPCLGTSAEMPAKKGKGKSKGKKKSKPNTPKKHMAGEFPLTDEQIAELKKVFNVFSKGSELEVFPTRSFAQLVLPYFFLLRSARLFIFSLILPNNLII